jgi:hypothetical protein
VAPEQFAQQELNLLAKGGIRVRNENGVLRPVIIDIRPGKFPNDINVDSTRTIPVAILSGPEFNAQVDVDKTSLTFGRIGNEKSLAFCNSDDDDEKRDSNRGLVCHFYISETGFQSGDTEGILKGKTHSGTAFSGADSVLIVHPTPEQKEEEDKDDQ